MVNIFASPHEMAENMALNMINQIERAGKSKIPLNIALSGGNTPRLLFSVLAEKYSGPVDWRYVNFFWVDERCVPPDDQESNYGAAYKILLSNINIPDSCIHRIKGEEDPETEALRYSEEIKNNVPAFRNLPAFDLIILGMGDDGHTASIFPGSNDLFESDKICETTVHPESGQERITITGRVINNAGIVTFMVTGKKKSGIINKILGEDPAAKKYPAAYVTPVHGKLNWMVDADAASLYKNKG